MSETMTLNRAQRRAMEKAAKRPPQRRRAVDANAFARAVWKVRAPARPLDRQQITDLAIGYHSALNAIANGTGTWDDANTLALAANVALLLLEAGLGIDQLPTVHAAQNAIMAMMRREEQVGRYVLTGPELRHLQDLLDLHDAQISDPDCTEAVMVAALSECKRRMLEGQVL